MQRIRILRIITRLNVGGPSFQAAHLCRALDVRGYETLLVAGEAEEREGDLREDIEEQGIRLVPIPHLRRGISARRDIRAFVQILRIVRRFRPDIVHTHMAKAGLLGRIAGRIGGVPGIVHTYHGHVFSGYFSRWTSAWIVRAERHLARHTDRIICVGPTITRHITQRYRIAPPEKVETVRLGVPAGRPGRPRIRRPTVGFVGRLVPIKDPLLFVDAAALIRKEAPQVRFAIAGDGPLREEVHARAKALGTVDALELHGWRGEMSRFYSSIDLLLLTSRNEGTPRSIIEAQAAGIPVVAVDVGGVGDLFTPYRLQGAVTKCEEGIMVSRRDPRILARAALDLLRDPGRRRAMGSAGHRRAGRDHSEEALVEAMDRVYREVLAQKR